MKAWCNDCEMQCNGFFDAVRTACIVHHQNNPSHSIDGDSQFIELMEDEMLLLEPVLIGIPVVESSNKPDNAEAGTVSDVSTSDSGPRPGFSNEKLLDILSNEKTVWEYIIKNEDDPEVKLQLQEIVILINNFDQRKREEMQIEEFAKSTKESDL